MRARRSLPEDSVGVFRNVFDLHTGHGAIMAPIAPQCKCKGNRPIGSSRALPDWESLTSQEVRDMTI
jgi:hypothetical protein